MSEQKQSTTIKTTKANDRAYEINQAAQTLADTKSDYDAQQQCLYDFELAAQWADEHPAVSTIRRIVELYKEWYVSDSQEKCVDYIKQRF